MTKNFKPYFLAILLNLCAFFSNASSSSDQLRIGFGASEQILNPIFKLESSLLEKYYQNPFLQFRNHTASIFIQKENRTLELNFFKSAGLVYFGGIDKFGIYPQWAGLSPPAP